MAGTPSPAHARHEAIREAKRLCLFSHFDADGMIDDYVLHYLRELRDAGFTVVFVTTANLMPGEVRRLGGLCVTVLERENFGLDFGGWVECLALFPDLEADLLLLANDSVYGPFWSLSEFVDELTSIPADSYGAVRALEPVSFLHSWFLLLRTSAYRSAPFQALMSQPVGPEMTKLEIIAKYEEAFTPLLVEAGLRYHVGFDPTKMGPVLATTAGATPWYGMGFVVDSGESASWGHGGTSYGMDVATHHYVMNDTTFVCMAARDMVCNRLIYAWNLRTFGPIEKP